MAVKEFVRGEYVVLAEGTYQGTLGVFLQLRPDTHWADIEETNGVIRSHPMQWLQHATSPDSPTDPAVSPPPILITSQIVRLDKENGL